MWGKVEGSSQEDSCVLARGVSVQMGTGQKLCKWLQEDEIGRKSGVNEHLER